MSNYDETIISDLYKDAYGFRPREGFYARWDASTEAEKQAIWDGLIVALEREILEDKARADRAVASWRADIARNLALGAQTRSKAIVWDAQSCGINLKAPQSAGSYCYERGIPFTFEKLVQRAFQAR